MQETIFSGATNWITRRYVARFHLSATINVIMNDTKEVKRLWVAQAQLRQAADFLSEPSKFKLPENSIMEIKYNLRRPHLEKFMIELEMLALEIGCKSGFWRRLKKVAETLDAQTKMGQYEAEFHRALARNA